MTEFTCGAAAVLRRGGPVQVPFRLCCAAALLQTARAADELPPRCPWVAEPPASEFASAPILLVGEGIP